MSDLIRFRDNTRKTAPVAADLLPGTDDATDEDVHYTMADIAAIMRILLADALVSTDDRTKLDTPVPAIGIQRRYYRGAVAPAVDSNNADPGPGWSSTLLTGTDAVWEIMAAFNNGVFVPPWSAPVQISGEKGIDGLPGEDGAPGNQYFFQTGAPTSVGRLVNDIWFDSTDGKYTVKRWNGTDWVESFQPLLLVDADGNITGVQRAGQAGTPFQILASVFQIWDGVSTFAPFEIVDGIVYIKQAVVRQITAAKIIGGTIVGEEIILDGTGAKIRSSDFVTGVSGWQISGTGAEFPALVVRSGNLENDATARRYGSKLSLSAVFSASTWSDLLAIDVTMEAGNDAHIAAALTFLAPSVPYPTDGLLRLLRADNSEVNGVSWTAQGGKAEVISYSFYDNIPTTQYKLQGQGVGGVFQGRDIAMNICVYRK